MQQATHDPAATHTARKPLQSRRAMATPSSHARPAARPERRYLPLHAVVGKPARSRWGGLKFRPAFGAKLRSSIWVRNIRRRSKRVFFCC